MSPRTLVVLGAVLLSGCFSEAEPLHASDGDESSGTSGSAMGSTGAATDATTGVAESTTGDVASTSGAESSSTVGSSSTGEWAESSTGEPCQEGTLGCSCDMGDCMEGSCRDDVCVESVCGDGLVEGDEACDDGNDVMQDGCEPGCTASTGVAKIASGDQFSCALFHDGRLRCWGSNSYGQLGYGQIGHVGDDETPASMGDVDVGAAVVDVACGREHTCVIVEGGAVRCWGFNNRWQLGIPSYGTNEVIGDEPDEVPSMLPDVNLGGTAVAITATTWSTLVLLDDGTVRCFGLNASFGTCGYGTNEYVIGDDEHPVVEGPIELGGVATAIDGHGDHACALLDDGTARCWGFNEDGALGQGDTETIGDDELPTSVPAIAFDEPITEIQTALRHTCVRLGSGGVKCWGRNVAGQLGLGHTEPVLGAHDQPALELGGAAVDLAAGGGHGCALLDDGNIRCWGDANFGRLGYGASGNDVGDDEMPDSQDPLELPFTVVHDVEVGNSFSCARVDGGEVACWGANSAGQLGQPGLDYFGDNETLGALSPIALED